MAVYFTDRSDDEILRTVNRICDSLEQEMRVSCTQHTRALVANALSAVAEDPSPSWRAARPELRDKFGFLVSSLPRMMSELARDEVGDGGLRGMFAKEDRPKLTFYQTLHWLTANLDRICPFEKPKR
jgi:hypothetical protein